jgi:hypothetical protein
MANAVVEERDTGLTSRHKAFLEEVAGFVGFEVYWIQRDYGFGPNR